MLESLFFTLFHYWPILLALTLVPALLTAWLREWRMTGIGWWNSSWAGLGGGILGVAVAIAWFCLSFMLRESALESALLFGFALLPIPSAASAWAVCGFWQPRSRL